MKLGRFLSGIRTVLVLCFALLFVGCVHPKQKLNYFGPAPMPWKGDLSYTALVGTYQFCDGGLIWELHLERDRTFALLLVSIPGERSELQASGQWTISSKQVILDHATDAAKKDIEAFNIASADGKLGLYEIANRAIYRRVYILTESPLTQRLPAK